jgi:hypothetical protein
LVFTTCANAGVKADIKNLFDTIFNSPQMICGPGCPVWVLDAQSVSTLDSKSKIQHFLGDNKYPNYLFVRFFEADRIEELDERLKSEAAKLEGEAAKTQPEKNDSVVLQSIIDQVRTNVECAVQASAQCFVLITPSVNPLSEQSTCSWRTKPI